MQRRSIPRFLVPLLVLSILLISISGSGEAQAKGLSNHMTFARALPATAQRAPTHSVSGQRQNLFRLPQEKLGMEVTGLFGPPLLTGRNRGKFAPAKKVADWNTDTLHNQNNTDTKKHPSNDEKGFNGMADSAGICPFFGQAGCYPPDMALATSPNYVLQGVNTSFTLYDTHGHTITGPLNAQTFFDIPNPSPSGCAPNGPYTGDPRAFYDPNDGYFWAAIEEFENIFDFNPNCQFLSRYWIASLNVKTGAMCTYGFDMALGSNNAADYTEFGFNRSTIAFSGDLFTAGSSGPDNYTPLPIPGFAYAESQFVNKHAMEQCQPVTPTAFTHYQIGNVLVDTVQPVETETTPANDPGVEYLMNTFNINGDPFGHDCLMTACQGFAVWAFDPTTQSLTGSAVVSNRRNPSYVSAPDADQPGCTQCVETFDTRITGTPVYSRGSGTGLISFAVNTAINNDRTSPQSTVPGVLWGQIHVRHDSGAVIGNLYQSGYLFFPGDQSASFGALMQDKTGRLVMVFDTMSSNLNPSIMVVSRNRFDRPGTFGRASFIVKGPSPTLQKRWGDFEATSYDGFSANHIWVASEYAINGPWATFIAPV